MKSLLNYEDGRVVCKLLDKTQDYYEEGSVQRHCVATYDGSTRSFIVSLRSNEERVTLEFDYSARLIQARSVCNSDPSEQMKPYIQRCAERVNELFKNDFLIKPELITHRKINNNLIITDMSLLYDELPF